jgi:hypothetical protein
MSEGSPEDFEFAKAEAESLRAYRRGQTQGPDVWGLVALAGLGLVLLGGMLLGYHWWLNDTTVVDPVRNDRVHNLGLVANRLAGMIGGGVLASIGAILGIGGALMRRGTWSP